MINLLDGCAIYVARAGHGKAAGGPDGLGTGHGPTMPFSKPSLAIESALRAIDR